MTVLIAIMLALIAVLLMPIAVLSYALLLAMKGTDPVAYLRTISIYAHVARRDAAADKSRLVL